MEGQAIPVILAGAIPDLACKVALGNYRMALQTTELPEFRGLTGREDLEAWQASLIDLVHRRLKVRTCLDSSYECRMLCE